MATTKQKLAHPKEPNELLEHVKQLAGQVPIEKLGAALKSVAKARGMTGARLELQFQRMDDPYYNVYRYAFFGKVPEYEGDPGLAAAAGKRIFPAKKAR